MSVQKPVSGRVNPRRPLGASALVGVGELHQRPVGRPDLLSGRPALKPQDLVRLLLRHRPWIRRASRPRVTIALSVYTPAGRPAVEIRL
jgi:hypothetical protein